VTKVIFACGDPNPRVAGSGAARLRAAGIVVETGLLAEEGEELNLGFFKRMRTGRPWLRLKLAASLDGRTALASGESKWITSPEAREDVHRFRAESAAILSTSATVLADDSELTARPISTGGAQVDKSEVSKKRLPLRVILDRHLRIPASARVFATEGDIVRLTASKAGASASANSRVEVIASGPDGHLSLAAALAWMGGAGLNEVWTEAGSTLAGALLDAQLADELVLYMAPRLLGADGRPLANLIGPQRLADSPEWRIHDLRQIGPDIRIMLRPNR
jgi:diaminohydroxyphosphoribosylaminopyrimidine deaminase/5-amino-6-(5-phosphoribosylamino)uracil reductase